MAERQYTDVGLNSKDSCLNVIDNSDGKFHLLISTTDLPQVRTAPATIDKTVLTDHSMTQTEGLQTNDQKTYTFNYHRDNLIQLNKYVGKELTFLERNPDNTGEKFTGTLTYSRNATSVNGVVQGSIFITVTGADELPIVDVRDLIKKTAIITTPLPDVYVNGTNSVEINLETLPSTATVTATSDSSTIATATYASGKLTITGVANGNTLVRLVTTATGEAKSFRTIAVTVEGV